jgi:hypothetical protein
MESGQSEDLPGNGPTPTEYLRPLQLGLNATAMDENTRVRSVGFKQGKHKIAQLDDIRRLNEVGNGEKTIPV